MKYVSLPRQRGPASGFSDFKLHFCNLTPETGDIMTPICVGPETKTIR